jgi:predicted PP-loop superfamily ATPase
MADLQKKELVDHVVLTARRIERGCDCGYDHRCGRCQAVIDLRNALLALDTNGVPGQLETKK